MSYKMSLTRDQELRTSTISEETLKSQLRYSLEHYGHKTSISADRINALGLFYHHISDNQQMALSFHEDALIIYLSLHDDVVFLQHQIAETLADIGNVYLKMKRADIAISYYSTSLWIWVHRCKVPEQHHRKLSVIRKMYLLTRGPSDERDLSEIKLPLYNLKPYSYCCDSFLHETTTADAVELSPQYVDQKETIHKSFLSRLSLFSSDQEAVYVTAKNLLVNYFSSGTMAA